MFKNKKAQFSILNLEKTDDHWLLHFAPLDADWLDIEDSRRDRRLTPESIF